MLLNMPASALGKDLRRLVGSDAVLTDEAARVLAGTDFITQRGVPAAVARPTSIDQVVTLLGYAAERGIPIVSRGAATNLSAAIVPGDDSLMLDLAGMNRILEIDARARRATVEPGVINADLKAAASREGLVYAPDPASNPISTIGGNIAENAVDGFDVAQRSLRAGFTLVRSRLRAGRGRRALYATWLSES
jgi:glycolate oxidase